MSGEKPAKYIVATEDARTLPTIEILTGRGFVTGKSGSGKSNSVSVIAEELLSAGYNMLIVDTEGEYFGLKEQYEILHVGHGSDCDVQIDIDRADKIAEIALHHNVPVILNVSDFLDQDEAKAVIASVVERLFILEGDVQKPFLLIVEEMQEYLSQTGGKDDLAKLLLRVAKRGRKRGLGLCGISQRPSAVDKDFITQCDWMVWHRLTWENDVEIVRKIMGTEIASDIPELGDGEAYLLTDWDDDVSRVQFRRKKTFDAGATPGLTEYERPSLKSIGDELIRQLESDDSIEMDDLTFDSPPDTTDTATGSSPQTDGEDVTSAHLGFDDDLQLLVDATTPKPDLDEISADEARDLLRQERRRSEILEAEVRELKDIINTVHETAGSTETTTAITEQEVAAPPALIDREPQRSGLVGTLIEIALFTTYLTYRCIEGIRGALLATNERLQRLNDRQRQTVRSYPVTDDRTVGTSDRWLAYVLIGIILAALGIGIVLFY